MSHAVAILGAGYIADWHCRALRGRRIVFPRCVFVGAEGMEKGRGQTSRTVASALRGLGGVRIDAALEERLVRDREDDELGTRQLVPGLEANAVLLQGLLRNPLADPFVTGTSAGATLAAVAAIVLGLAAPLVPLAAFAGALVTVTLVWRLARLGGGTTVEVSVLAEADQDEIAASHQVTKVPA